MVSTIGKVGQKTEDLWYLISLPFDIQHSLVDQTEYIQCWGRAGPQEYSQQCSDSKAELSTVKHLLASTHDILAS